MLSTLLICLYLTWHVFKNSVMFVVCINFFTMYLFWNIVSGERSFSTSVTEVIGHL